jgi:DNA repair exonuclease SbcCD ATPase subunit
MHNYKLSDNAKFTAIWSLLNVNFCEEGNWTVEYDIVEIYDEYAVVKNYNEGIFERIYYTKDDATDSVELGERTRCFFVDVSEAEKKALDALHGLNNNTYELVDENYSAALAEVEAKTGELNTANEALEAKTGELNAANEALEAKTAEFDTLTETYNTEKSENETKIGELNESIATLTTERDNALSSLVESQTTVVNLNEEIASLNSFKAEIEKKEKEAVVAKYSKLLSEEILSAYTSKLDEYTDIKALDKDLAYELVSTNKTVFTANGNPQPAYVPRDTGVGNGLEGILDKYKK